MASKPNKFVIYLIVTLVSSLIITLIAMGIIDYQICYSDGYTTHCFGRIFFEWFLPVFGITFGIVTLFYGILPSVYI